MKEPKSSNVNVEINVYGKLQKVRRLLSEMKLKMSGKNEYSNFKYFELGDFLPQVNQLNDEWGLMTRFNIFPVKGAQKERAVLEIIDTSKPEDKIAFVSDTADVEVGKKKDGSGGAMPIQNLGAKQTYMRRYMLMIAYEIIEADSVDNKKNAEEKELDAEQIARINGAKDLDDLVAIGRDLKAKLHPSYQKSLIQYYNAKKSELGGGDENA